MKAVSDPIDYLEQEIAPARRLLLNNGLYARLETLADLRRFMEHHVFAVWDFMSLLKALQRELTCVQVPWVPTASASLRYLINEMVLEEESDLDPQGRPISHFELYVRAMEECGADAAPIRRLVAAVAAGRPVAQALVAASAPDTVRYFVENTFQIIRSGKSHALAAAFTFGRHDLIPVLFRELVSELRDRFPGHLDTLTYYLDRHVHLDEAGHALRARQMVRELCADDPGRWQDCQQVATRCLEARLVLWEGIKPSTARPVLV